MKRKIWTLMAAMVMMTVVAYSQGFGIRAGVGLQNINGKESDGDKLELKMIPAFHAGINYEIGIAEEFYLQPGLLFATKGAKDEIEEVTSKFNLSYLELDINLVYKPALGNGHLMIGFGPYVAYGIMGKLKSEGEVMGVDYSAEMDIKFKNKVTADDYEDDLLFLKGLDAGANLFVGYELGFGLSFQLNTQLGLLDMTPAYEGDEDTDDESKMSNTGFGLSVGYRF